MEYWKVMGATALRFAFTCLLVFLGLGFIIGAATCFAHGHNLCITFGIVAATITPIAVVSSRNFAESVATPLVTALVFATGCELLRRRVTRARADQPPSLFELRGKSYMEFFVAIFSFSLSSLFATWADFSYNSVENGNLAGFPQLVVAFLVALWMLCQALSVLIRHLLGLPLLIVTAERIRFWEFPAYQDIVWSDFGGAEYRPSFRGASRIALRYRTGDPTLLQQFVGPNNEGFFTKRISLATVVPDSPDIADRINRIWLTR
jgi:FtsH-binding integral membrane protein